MAKNTMRRGVCTLGALLLLGGCAPATVQNVEPASMTCEEHLETAREAEAAAERREAASRTTANAIARGTHWLMKSSAERERNRAAAHRAAAELLRETNPAACAPAEPERE